MYYTYDGNGNVIRISNKPGDGQNSSNSNSDTFKPPMDTGANTGWAGVAYGREPGGSGGGNEQATQYKWDEENRLIHARVNGNEIDFLYNAGGERTAKYGKDGEVIYYDKMFQVKTNVSPLHITKHIFLGSTRVVSKLSHELGPIDLEYEKRNAYYYHGDHLGSSNYVTDYEGNEYEHYEYTPYGEMWVEEESDSLDKINFKFTSKELDEETGLYYFGARYLDAKASRWLSCDPILNDYLPSGDKERDKNLPGLGGVFNPVNLAVYHYAGNPLKYTDPDGKATKDIVRWFVRNGDNLINVTFSGLEVATGVVMLSNPATAFFGGLLIAHGSVNFVSSVGKMTATTVTHLTEGAEAADTLDAKLPDTWSGFVLYGMTSAICEWTNNPWKESNQQMAGAFGDIADIGISIALGKAKPHGIKQLKILAGKGDKRAQYALKLADKLKKYVIKGEFTEKALDVIENFFNGKSFKENIDDLAGN